MVLVFVHTGPKVYFGFGVGSMFGLETKPIAKLTVSLLEVDIPSFVRELGSATSILTGIRSILMVKDTRWTGN